MASCLGRTALNLHRPTAGTSGRVPGGNRHFSHKRAPCPAPRAAETETGSAYTFKELADRRNDLELEMKLAVKGEDFKAAARVKEQLEELNRKDPVMLARTALERAIKEERYEDAGRLKAQLEALQAELGPEALQAGLLSTTSTAVTQGIRVTVQSFYLPTKSSPSAGRYMFAYHVIIANETTDTIVQLRSRHWVIMDITGKTEEVRGPGVVGDQPILLPGKSHEYTSGCPLVTPQGSMEGEFSMVVLSAEDGTWAETMEVKIAKFKLDAKGPQAV